MRDQLDSLLHGPDDVCLDSAKAMGERLLTHDSIKNDMELRRNLLDALATTARLQNDTIKWMQRSRELIDLCHEIGDDAGTDALRMEAELGAALCAMGQQEQGMAKLDSVIFLLENSLAGEDKKGRFSELDALIIALKRKIVFLSTHGHYAETLPLARCIIERLDDYKQNLAAFHDDSHREPSNDTKREEYINFYRSQAQSFITAAYLSLGEHSNMLDAFEKIERVVRDVTVREYNARYRALQQQMAAEREQAKANWATLIAISIGILALLFFFLAVVVIFKNRSINQKNRMLAQRIADAINYKKMYWEEKRAQTPSAAPDTSAFTDEQFFQYINEVIVRERLFLDPKFERQTIMDRFQLSKERVGAIFSKGSRHTKMTSYVQQLRLEYAAKLLVEQPEKSIVQIASASGFGSHTYFSGCFRQHFGLSPTDFRRNALSQREYNTAS